MPYPHHLHDKPRPAIPDTVPAALAAGKQLIEIILLKSELTHDIESDIARIERARKLEETPILTNNETDDYTLRRQMDAAINKVVSRCQAYLLLPSPFVHRVSVNHAKEWEEKSIWLGLPQNWPPHLIDALRSVIHDYIVKSVEFSLLAVALPQDAYTSLCNTQALDYYDDINVMLNTRLGPSLIHPTFLG